MVLFGYYLSIAAIAGMHGFVSIVIDCKSIPAFVLEEKSGVNATLRFFWQRTSRNTATTTAARSRDERKCLNC